MEGFRLMFRPSNWPDTFILMTRIKHSFGLIVEPT